MMTNLKGKGQRVGCRACDMVFRDRTTEPRPGALSRVRPPGRGDGPSPSRTRGPATMRGEEGTIK